MSESLGRTVDWRDNGATRPNVVMIDQTRLPRICERISYDDYRDVARAIETMVVRGAPAIGAAAALGLALAAFQIDARDRSEFGRQFESASELLRGTRPTAVNLFWAIDRMNCVARDALSGPVFDIAHVRGALRAEALAVLDEDENANRALGEFGADLIPDGARVLTHCNAGALACVAYGTALGVIRSAVAHGKRIAVVADETRPRLQGMSLTAWELAREGIDVTVICDNAAGYLMSRGEIDCAIVGADRIASNGDTANKIGTYGVAVLSRAHGIPMYVAAPLSTVDFGISSGADIPIEQRDPREVTHFAGTPIGPPDIKTLNYAFDVTPANLITAIITDKGVARPEYGPSLLALRG